MSKLTYEMIEEAVEAAKKFSFGGCDPFIMAIKKGSYLNALGNCIMSTGEITPFSSDIYKSSQIFSGEK
jgi:hypothetical protein